MPAREIFGSFPTLAWLHGVFFSNTRVSSSSVCEKNGSLFDRLFQRHLNLEVNRDPPEELYDNGPDFLRELQNI